MPILLDEMEAAEQRASESGTATQVPDPEIVVQVVFISPEARTAFKAWFLEEHGLIGGDAGIQGTFYALPLSLIRTVTERDEVGYLLGEPEKVVPYGTDHLDLPPESERPPD